jgi:murein DD-endopeptidase MepM/ murein hydrolase activator NlpD
MPRPFGHGPVAWFLKRAALLVALGCVLVWALLLIDRRTLPGLAVRGARLPRTAEPARALQAIAQRFLSGEISIATGPHLTRATRRDLGASLALGELPEQLLALGRTGNPLIDLATFWDIALNGRDVLWAPSIDRMVLGRYVHAIRRNVERPPIAGATDGEGWSIAGAPGLTLDTVSAIDTIERALRSGESSVESALREVPAPEALAMGSPDAVLYEDEHVAEDMVDFEQLAAGDYAAAMARARPSAWLPSRGKEPMAPPYERFGQGPRKVALPSGPAAELAESIGLGTTETVGHLLRAAPKPEWRQAAGPSSHPATMLWPVPGGRLWRRFGYVRSGEWASKLHRGIDIGAAHGTPILAVNDGVVAYSDNRVSGYGNLLVIVHVDGSVTFSAHCQAIFVFPGQRVHRGEIVGEVGDTGLARGAHVHFEYKTAGRPVDPIELFARK